MALSREKVVDAALSILRANGLGSLSMRHVATELGVQPGALYWHVKSKQDLLAVLAERILTPPLQANEEKTIARDARQQALEIRTALLSVRDGAEIVSFVQALRPQSLAPIRKLREILADDLPNQSAEWGARTLIHYILGAVAEEQNYAELTLASIAPADSGSEYSIDAFLFGVNAILCGLNTASAEANSL